MHELPIVLTDKDAEEGLKKIKKLAKEKGIKLEGIEK